MCLCSKTHSRLHEVHLLPSALSSFEVCKCVDTHEHIDNNHIFCIDLHFYIHYQQKSADLLISSKLLNLDITWCPNHCNSESLCRAVAQYFATSFAWDQLWPTQLAMDAGADQPGLWMRLSIEFGEFGTSKYNRISAASPWHISIGIFWSLRISRFDHTPCVLCSICWSTCKRVAALPLKVSFMPALQLQTRPGVDP